MTSNQQKMQSKAGEQNFQLPYDVGGLLGNGHAQQQQLIAATSSSGQQQQQQLQLLNFGGLNHFQQQSQAPNNNIMAVPNCTTNGLNFPGTTQAQAPMGTFPSNDVNLNSLLAFIPVQQFASQPFASQQLPLQVQQQLSPQSSQQLPLQPSLAGVGGAVQSNAAVMNGINNNAALMAALSSQQQQLQQLQQLAEKRQQKQEEKETTRDQAPKSFSATSNRARGRKCFTRESWDAMYERLVLYKEEHGNCLVPQKYKEDPKLGNWVKVQRQTEESMGAEKRAKLNDVGFCWRLVKKTEREPWDVMFQRLVKHKEKFGDCLVPKRFSEDRKLGRWVHWQRERQDVLPAEHKQKLNEIGFVWRHAGCRVPTSAQAATAAKSMKKNNIAKPCDV